jgi:2-dehydro-3-deoxygluconokinase
MTLLVGLGEPLAVFTAELTGAARTGDAFRLGLGGAECNVAIGACRLGHGAAVIGRVGDDPLGAALTAALRADAVDVRSLRVDAEAATGVMFKELRTAGRVRASYARRHSAGSRLASGDLDADLLARASVLHTTGITASFGDSARAAIRDAADQVHAAGGLVSFDLNYRQRLWPDPVKGAAHLRDLVRQADVVFLTLAEAQLLLDTGSAVSAAPPALAAQVAELGPGQVLLKVDAGNVVAVVDGERHMAQATPVAAVDPVGAGDAFAAGYLSALMAGRNLAARLEIAMTMGRWSVTTHGDNQGLPHADELDLLQADDVIR